MHTFFLAFYAPDNATEEGGQRHSEGNGSDLKAISTKLRTSAGGDVEAAADPTTKAEEGEKKSDG